MKFDLEKQKDIWLVKFDSLIQQWHYTTTDQILKNPILLEENPRHARDLAKTILNYWTQLEDSIIEYIRNYPKFEDKIGEIPDPESLKTQMQSLDEEMTKYFKTNNPNFRLMNHLAETMTKLATSMGMYQSYKQRFEYWGKRIQAER